MKKFTKDMLEDRMVVETRNGSCYLVCGNMLMGTSESIYIAHYNNDLLYNESVVFYEMLDIVKVYDKIDFLSDVKRYHSKLLWDRNDCNTCPQPDVKEVTLKEIAEKFGVDEVKVIDD